MAPTGLSPPLTWAVRQNWSLANSVPKGLSWIGLNYDLRYLELTGFGILITFQGKELSGWPKKYHLICLLH